MRGAGEERKGGEGEGGGGGARPREKTYNLQQTLGKKTTGTKKTTRPPTNQTRRPGGMREAIRRPSGLRRAGRASSLPRSRRSRNSSLFVLVLVFCLDFPVLDPSQTLPSAFRIPPGRAPFCPSCRFFHFFCVFFPTPKNIKKNKPSIFTFCLQFFRFPTFFI